MDNNKFLDVTGLIYFWEKAKSYISNLFTQPRYLKPYQATYDGLGYVTNFENYQHALFSIIIPELGDTPTAKDLEGIVFNVTIPDISTEAGFEQIAYFGLRVNNGPYWAIRVFNGSFSSISSILPFYNMILGYTITLSMFIRNSYETTHQYYAQFMIQNYIKPYGNNLSANSWAISKGGTGATTATNARKNLGAAAAPKLTAVTLSADRWSNKAQDVSVPGVTADETEQLIQIVPAKVSVDAYELSRVSCWSQTTNKLTFIYEASSKPTEDLTVYVVVQPL